MNAVQISIYRNDCLHARIISPRDEVFFEHESFVPGKKLDGDLRFDVDEGLTVRVSLPMHFGQIGFAASREMRLTVIHHFIGIKPGDHVDIVALVVNGDRFVELVNMGTALLKREAEFEARTGLRVLRWNNELGVAVYDPNDKPHEVPNAVPNAVKFADARRSWLDRFLASLRGLLGRI